MVRAVARQHCFRLKCSVVQQRSDAKAVAAAVYCRRCINAGTRRACKPLQLLQALTKCGENPCRAIFAVHHFCAPTTRIGDAAPFLRDFTAFSHQRGTQEPLARPTHDR